VYRSTRWRNLKQNAALTFPHKLRLEKM